MLSSSWFKINKGSILSDALMNHLFTRLILVSKVNNASQSMLF